jgi:hypothetical protein
MRELNSLPWVELAAMAPGQSHYWFFDPSWAAHGWVFQATAHPEPPDPAETGSKPSRVEVTELFIQRKSLEDGECGDRINITVTNCGDRWASYSLWVAGVAPGAAMAPRSRGRNGLRRPKARQAAQT